MARILELIPGSDGVKRVARLKTTKGELNRPTRRLIPLELRDSRENLPVNDISTNKAKELANNPIKIPDVIKRPAKKNKKKKITEDTSTEVEEEKVSRFGRKITKPDRYA